MKKIKFSVAALTMTAILATSFVSCNKKTENAAPAPQKVEAKAEVAAPVEEKKSAELPAIASKNIVGIYMSANDLSVANLTATLNAEDGFVLNATEEKAMAVEQPSEPMTIGSEVFSNRLSTKGTGTTEVRNVTFPAKAGDSIVIWAAQGGSSNRPLVVVNASNEPVAEFSMLPKEGKTIVPGVFEATAPADGLYSVYSKSGGCYIYQIKVGKPE